MPHLSWVRPDFERRETRRLPGPVGEQNALDELAHRPIAAAVSTEKR